MKVIIAPQTFKGSISALDVAKAMAKGVTRALGHVEVVLVPVADGGDGTLETLIDGSGGEIRSTTVTGPLGKKITATWGAMGDGITAVIEMARSSGLALVPLEHRDPLSSTTYGVGETIIAALDEGFRRFIMGIGGSATNDGGAGMAQAIGVGLKNSAGDPLPFGGAALADLASIDMSGLDPRVKESTFLVACDVSNPLTGPEGASTVYGPQKGASPQMVDQLDEALGHLARIVGREIGVDIDQLKGSGAAGGLGGGMVAFLGADLRTGVDIVLDVVGIDAHLDGADLVVTGEGCLDYQTVYSKAPIGVAKRASLRDIPVIAISGSLGKHYNLVHEHGIDAAVAIPQGPITLKESSKRAAELTADATEEAMRMLKVGGRLFSGA